MNLSEIHPYWYVIAASLIIIASYFFNLISAKTSIPGVLMLIALGIALRYSTGVTHIDGNSPILNILGTVGLIMIVLEASLDLELKKDKLGLIIRSFSVALLALVLSVGIIAFVLQFFLEIDFFTSLVYAIPLSIMSSAIIIPSVADLPEKKREFMVYESTFSDILGIMFFYFLLGSVNHGTPQEIGLDILVNISLTLVISVVLSYLIIFLFQKIQSEAKLFLLISVLVLLYVVGKMLHLSSLIIILFFGLILHNRNLFFRGKLKNLINESELDKVFKDFKMITIETAFVVRTFFFVLFGLTISLGIIFHINVFFISIILLMVLYGVRFLMLLLFMRKDFGLELTIAPRGLITVLLFFAIPEEFQAKDFEQGILLFVIIASSIVMTVGLIMYRKNRSLDEPEKEPLQDSALKFNEIMSEESNSETKHKE